mmetsp:Transcript_163592/g.519797  ORF Transcript_163592/g.519797 Transcript_163592/m.519797 type:complete len:105 (-) Transcript_163592:499-813(-)
MRRDLVLFGFSATAAAAAAEAAGVAAAAAAAALSTFAFFFDDKHDNGLAPLGPFFFLGFSAWAAANASFCCRAGSLANSQLWGKIFVFSAALISAFDAVEGSSK